jgi:Protein of unknown function (DUF2971)
MNAYDDVPAEMRKAIEAVERNTAIILDTFKRQIVAKPTPPTIFHYTNEVGLRGIVETGILQLTDIFYLNDPSELRHGCEPAIEFITAEGSEARPEIKAFASELRARLQGGMQAANLFVLSFSEAGNDLAQWRAYADNGRGYALGFDTHMLEQAFGKSRLGCQTFPVCYSEDDLRHMHRQIIDQLCPLISTPGKRR